MFKLYTNLAGWEKVKIPFYTEQEVVQAMIYCQKKYNTYYFMVIERLDNCDSIRTVTRTEEDFNEYIAEVNDRYNRKPIDDMSCVELKRYILKRSKTR